MRTDEPHDEFLAVGRPGAHRARLRGLEAVGMLLAGGRDLGSLSVHNAAMIAHTIPLCEMDGAGHFAYASAHLLSHKRDRPLSGRGRLFRDMVLEANDAGPLPLAPE